MGDNQFVWHVITIDIPENTLTLAEKLSRWKLPSLSELPHRSKGLNVGHSTMKGRKQSDKRRKEEDEELDHRKRMRTSGTEDGRRNRRNPSREKFRRERNDDATRRHSRGSKRKHEADFEDVPSERLARENILHSLKSSLLRGGGAWEDDGGRDSDDRCSGRSDNSAKHFKEPVGQPTQAASLHCSPRRPVAMATPLVVPTSACTSEVEKETMLLKGLKKALKPVAVHGVVRRGRNRDSPHPPPPPPPRERFCKYSAQSRLKKLTESLHQKNAEYKAGEDLLGGMTEEEEGRAWAGCSGYVPSTGTRAGLEEEEEDEEEEEEEEDEGVAGGTQQQQQQEGGGGGSGGDSTDNEPYEPMDWSRVPEQAVVKTLKKVRSLVDLERHPFQLDVQPRTIDILTEPCEQNLYVVVDTNILISCVKLVKGVIKSRIKGFKTVVVVPWQVLKELDYLKEQRMNGGESFSAVAGQARRGIGFLLENNGRILCQSQEDALAEFPTFVVQVPDDEILKCCLQVQSNGHYILLCSNDRNLLVKATAMGLTSASDEMMTSIIDNPKAKPLKSCVSDLERPPPPELTANEVFLIAHRLASITYNFLSTCIEGAMREAYKGMWEFHLAVVRPWTLLDALTCAQLQWSAVTGHDDKDQVNLLKKVHRFFSVSEYDDELTEIELQGALLNVISLANSLPRFFKPVADVCLETVKQLKLKNEEIIERAATEGIYRTVEYVQRFEKDVKLICLSVYNGLNEECPVSEKEELSEEAAPEFHAVLPSLPSVVGHVQAVVAAMFSLKVVEVGSVTGESGGVGELLKALTTFVGVLPSGRLKPQDVVYFANSLDVREKMDGARNEFQKLLKIFLRAQKLLQKR